MKYKIHYTSLATKDLKSVLEYIVHDGYERAVSVFDLIESKIFLLSEQPELGRPGRVPGTRELVIPEVSYIVPYKILDQKLIILRVYHARRAWPEGL